MTQEKIEQKERKSLGRKLKFVMGWGEEEEKRGEKEDIERKKIMENI